MENTDLDARGKKTLLKALNSLQYSQAKQPADEQAKNKPGGSEVRFEVVGGRPTGIDLEDRSYV